MGKRAVFEGHLAESGSHWIPLWQDLTRFIDWDGNHNYAFDISHEISLPRPLSKQSTKPWWLPDSQWYY
jgi:hypothetical protein